MAIHFNNAQLDFAYSPKGGSIVLNGSELTALSGVQCRFLNLRSKKFADDGHWVDVARFYSLPMQPESNNGRLIFAIPDALATILKENPSNVAVIVTGTVRLGNIQDVKASEPLPLDGTEPVATSNGGPVRRPSRRSYRAVLGGVAALTVILVGVVLLAPETNTPTDPVAVETGPAPLELVGSVGVNDGGAVEPNAETAGDTAPAPLSDPANEDADQGDPKGSAISSLPVPDRLEPSTETALALIGSGKSADGLELLRRIAPGDSEACYQLARLYDPALRDLTTRPGDIAPDMNFAFRWYGRCGNHPGVDASLQRLEVWVAKRAKEGDAKAIALLPLLERRDRSNNQQNWQ